MENYKGNIRKGQQYVAADIKEAPPGAGPFQIRLGGVSGPSNFLASMHVAAYP